MRLASPLLFIALAVSIFAVSNLGFSCGPVQSVGWICLNPDSGKEDGMVYDANHYVNGVLDPCHCYDPCGPAKSCPIVVDAGPPASGCDAGAGGSDGGW